MVKMQPTRCTEEEDDDGDAADDADTDEEAPWLAGRVPGFFLLLLGLRGCCFPWGLLFGEIS